MHEVSLVKSLLRQVAEIAEQHQAVSVQEVKIEIGPLTGVEKILVQEAYDQLAVEYVGSNCRLVIVEVPLQGMCDSCKNSIVIHDFRFLCEVCGSPDVNITSGDAFRLQDITIDTETTLGITEQT